MGAGAVSDSFTSFQDPISHTGLPCPALIQREVPIIQRPKKLSSNLICCIWLISMGDLPFSKQRRGWQRRGGGGRETGGEEGEEIE